MLGRYAKVGDLGGLDDDVLALGVFVTLDDLVLLDRCGGFAGSFFESGGKDFLMADALAVGAADLMEADFAFCFGGDEELDAEGDERDLDVARPVGTRQDAPRRTQYK